MRRAFADLPHGQVHYWRGPLREGTPLVMLHGSPGSSHSLLPYARILCETRDVIVLDTPGNGDSSPCATGEPTIPGLADILSQAIRAIGIRQYFAYGYHTGASIAIALATSEPERVRKLVLEGISFFTPEERARLMKNEHAPRIEPDDSGSHLVKAWDMIRSAHVHWPWWDRSREAFRGRDVPSARELHHEALQVLKSLETYHLSYRAALAFDKSGWLSRLSLPVLATCSRTDQLWPSLQQVSRHCPAATVCEIPGFDRHEDRVESCRIFEHFLEHACPPDTHGGSPSRAPLMAS